MTDELTPEWATYPPEATPEPAPGAPEVEVPGEPVPEVPVEPVTAPESASESEVSVEEAPAAPDEPSASEYAAAIDAAEAQADAAHAAFVEQTVERTHGLGVSLRTQDSVYVAIPATPTQGPRTEEFIGGR